MAQSSEVTVYSANKSTPLGKIVLNGYNFNAGGAVDQKGIMHSFAITEGSLYDVWSTQAPVTLHHEDGQEVLVKIAALPVEEDGYGLIQFI